MVYKKYLDMKFKVEDHIEKHTAGVAKHEKVKINRKHFLKTIKYKNVLKNTNYEFRN